MTGDCAVVKAADMQEPSELILDMVASWKKGNNVTAESQWNNINFKEAIFTLEDVK